MFSHHRHPEDNILINKAVEVLIEEEEAGADESRVTQMKLTPGHVSDLEKEIKVM